MFVLLIQLYGFLVGLTFDFPHNTIYRDFQWADLCWLIIVGLFLANRQRIKIPPSLFVLSACAMAVTQFISLAVHFPSGTADVFAVLVIIGRTLYLVTVSVVVADVCRNIMTFKRLFNSILLGYAVITAMELVSYLSASQFQLHYGHRLGNTYINPNTLSSELSLLLPLIGSCFFSSRHRLEKVTLLGCGLGFLTAIVLTFSKGGWVSAATGLLVLLVLLPGLRRRIRTTILTFVVAGIFLLSPAGTKLVSALVERWVSAASQISNQERVLYLEAAWRTFEENPIIGAGLKSFLERYRALHPYREGGPEDAHNLYLNTLAQNGLLGFLALMGLGLSLALVLFEGVRATRDRDNRLLLAGFAGYLAVFCVNSLFTAHLINLRQCWVAFGLLIAVYYRTRMRVDYDPAGRYAFRRTPHQQFSSDTIVSS